MKHIIVSKWFHIPYDISLKERARELRKKQTPTEKKLWYEFLRLQKYQFYRQKPIDYYIADFYCPKLKLVIEIDWGSHFTEKWIDYDKERTNKLENWYWVKILRFTNHEIGKNFQWVCEIISDYIEKFSEI